MKKTVYYERQQLRNSAYFAPSFSALIEGGEFLRCFMFQIYFEQLLLSN